MANEDIFKRAAEIIAGADKDKEAKKKLLEEDRRALIEQMGTQMERVVGPILSAMVENTNVSLAQMRESIAKLKIEAPTVNMPPMPSINVPQPKVTVNVPEAKAPIVNVPKADPIQFPTSMDVGLDKYGDKNPLKVMMMDVKGRPMNFSMGAGGGGKADFLTIKGYSASAFSEIQNSDGRLRVSVETGGSGLTDNELRATAVPVSQLSGAIWSTEVSTIFGSTGTNVVNPDGRLKVELPTGSSGITDTEIRATALPVSQVSGANWSVSVTNTVSSTISVGDLASDAVDTGSAPVKTGGIARQANPTAVAAGDRVAATYDDLGRQVMRPVQVRDMVQTAYVALANGTETTLLAATAGSFHDLTYIMGANNSDAAVSVDIRDVTAGGIVMGLEIPANGTAGVSLNVPYKQSETGNNWTVDMGDITGTTVKISALFSREI